MDARPDPFLPNSPVVATAGAVEATLAVGGGRQLALTPAALRVEVRNGRDWRVAREIRYGEIAAVYQYQVRDWGYLGLGLLYGLTLLSVVLFVALLAQIDGFVAGAVAVVVSLLVIALTAYRIATVPRRWLRIETHAGPLLLPGRNEFFFEQLAAHLSPPAQTAAPVTPTPAVIPPAPAPPA